MRRMRTARVAAPNRRAGPPCALRGEFQPSILVRNRRSTVAAKVDLAGSQVRNPG